MSFSLLFTVNQRHTSGITVYNRTAINIKNTVRAVHSCNSWFLSIFERCFHHQLPTTNSLPLHKEVILAVLVKLSVQLMSRRRIYLAMHLLHVIFFLFYLDRRVCFSIKIFSGAMEANLLSEEGIFICFPTYTCTSELKFCTIHF